MKNLFITSLVKLSFILTNFILVVVLAKSLNVSLENMAVWIALNECSILVASKVLNDLNDIQNNK